MPTSFSVCVVGEERIFTEALSIALRTRGVAATAIFAQTDEPAQPSVAPDVLVVAIHGNCEYARLRLAAARKSFPYTKIILLGSNAHKDLARYVLENVVHCVIGVDSFDKLLRTLEKLRDVNSLNIERDLARCDSAHFASPGAGAPDLTLREQEIFKLLSAGLSNKEIANLLTISTSTVKNHVHSILGKLNLSRRSYALGHSYEPSVFARTLPAPHQFLLHNWKAAS